MILGADDSFTPDGKFHKKDTVFNLYNLPMTSKAKARMN